MSVNTSQLICACSEDVAGDAVWACSLVRVKTFKCFTQGVINYFCKLTSQLVCACSEDASNVAKNTVWASSLAKVNKFKCFTHVSH